MDIGGDIFDVRDVITRFEELESELDEAREAAGATWDDAVSRVGKTRDEFILEHLDVAHPEALEEHKALKKFLDEVQGSGCDHKWNGHWYPVIFIRDGYFEDYAREYAEDTGSVDRKASWPHKHIDWEAAAEELREDYSSVEFGGETYWYRG